MNFTSSKITRKIILVLITASCTYFTDGFFQPHLPHRSVPYLPSKPVVQYYSAVLPVSEELDYHKGDSPLGVIHRSVESDSVNGALSSSEYFDQEQLLVVHSSAIVGDGPAESGLLESMINPASRGTIDEVTFRKWARKLVTSMDFTHIHKLSSATYLLSSVLLLSYGGLSLAVPNLNALKSSIIDPLSCFWFVTTVLGSFSSIAMAYAHRHSPKDYWYPSGFQWSCGRTIECGRYGCFLHALVKSLSGRDRRCSPDLHSTPCCLDFYRGRLPNGQHHHPNAGQC